MGLATSDALMAAVTKAFEATETSLHPFEAALIARGLDRQETHRVWRFLFAQYVHHITQYQASSGEQRRALDSGFRVVYASGLGRLFWDKFSPDGRGRPVSIGSNTFADHVNQLIEEVDRQPEALQ